MLKSLLRPALAVVIALVIVCVFADFASACPTCKDGVSASDPQHAGLVRGYFYSILLMMGMPFALISCFSIYMYREVQKARALEAAKRASKNEAASLTPQ